MLLGSMSVKHVEKLKEIFAKLTSTGWVIPDWLIYLENQLSGSREL